LGYLPFVHGVNAETPESNRYVAGKVIRLSVLAGQAIREQLQRAISRGGQTKVSSGVVVEEVVITDVIAAVVAAELEAVVSVRPSVVVNELILSDVATLREIKLRANDIGKTARLWAKGGCATEL